MLKVDGIPRCVSAADTVANLRAVAESLGVTRLADITGLDRIGIPVYSSIVPDSRDILSVYNGKGLRPIDAKAGALMEAIERQTALRVRLPFIEGSFTELRETASALDPKSLTQELAADYSDDRTYSWTQGLDIVSGQPCYVPTKLAGFMWYDVPHPSPYFLTETNGLASGNCREEAICHALCELAERDAWTETELAAHHLPKLRRLFALGPDAEDGPDDLELYPCIEPDSDQLFENFHQAGLFPVVRDITSRLGVPTIFATVADDNIVGYPMAHSGMGTHPNARVALRRALTELAQSRAVDIQAVREDIAPPDAVVESFSLHMRRVSTIRRDSWYHAQSKCRRRFSDIPSHPFQHIDEDLAFLIERFTSSGLNQIIVIDFTPDQPNYSVVRVIVPGIESWALNRSGIGQRAVDFWIQHA
jgi:ribosomal protein S12 methylthiotransferase accessory factor